MSYINELLRGFFDFLFSPFQSSPPILAMLAACAITAALTLCLFSALSNREGMRTAKRQMAAHLLEMRIFQDDPKVLLAAPVNILLCTLKSLRYSLRPMLVMVVPFILIVGQLESWFGHKPLKPGETAIVSVIASYRSLADLAQVSLETDAGLVIETLPLRIPQQGRIDWRIRASRPDEHQITVRVGSHAFQKRVVATDQSLARVAPSRVKGGFWEALFHPGEEPIADSSPLREIQVLYSSREIDLFGWEVHWIAAFLILTTLLALIGKWIFRIEI